MWGGGGICFFGPGSKAQVLIDASLQGWEEALWLIITSKACLDDSRSLCMTKEERFSITLQARRCLSFQVRARLY